VKNFKNLQQTTQQIMVILMLIERKNLQDFFYIISQVLNVSIFGNTADLYEIVHLVPHACQHITIDHICLLLPPSGKSGKLCASAFPYKKLGEFLSLSA
jgi:hypothetical protein